MRIHCPQCQAGFEREILRGDESIECPHCRQSFLVNTKETVLYFQTPPPSGDGGPARLDRRGAQLLGPGDRLGGFVVEKILGEGGMGVVYLANQLSLGKKVAVKVLPPDLGKNPEFISRFNREARALAALNHPNIVTIIDKGFENDLYYFVMEYVEGISLRQVLREKKLTADEALRIIPALCSALEYAHERGIVHRDIKPENILITPEGRIKIADFGLSKIVEGDNPPPPITRTHTTVGTFEYMAPEQRESSRTVDRRADLYSLGVVLYEMLTGELPIGRFPPPSAKNGKISQELDAVVLRALDKDPERRYQKASDVANEVERASQIDAAAVLPILEEPPRPRSRIDRALASIRNFAVEYRGMLIVTFILVCFAPRALGPWLFVFALYFFVRITNKRREKAADDKMGAVPLQIVGPPPPAPPPVPAPPSLPKTSLLCWFTFLFGMGLSSLLYLLRTVYGSDILGAFREGSPQEMAGHLIAFAFWGFPGLLGILVGLFASGRAKRRRMRGRWIARLGVVASVVFLVQITAIWDGLYNEYRFWRQFEARLETHGASDQDYWDLQNNPADSRLPRRVRTLVRYDPDWVRRRLLPEATPGVKKLTLVELGKLGDPASLPDVEKFLAPPADPDVRLAAMESLAGYPAADGVEVVERYQKKLGGVRDELGRYTVRKEVLAAIAVLKSYGTPATLPLLATWAADPDEAVASGATEAILASPLEGATMIDALARVLGGSPSAGLRQQAARRLAEDPSGAGIAHLVVGLADADSSVRWTSFVSLKARFGQDHGYNPDLAPDSPENAKAIESFRETVGGN
ncbi:MAG: protein kinase [Planctomycetes bacterium]|nr:protein kinase [Planctomycetota bacterium]